MSLITTYSLYHEKFVDKETWTCGLIDDSDERAGKIRLISVAITVRKITK